VVTAHNSAGNAAASSFNTAAAAPATVGNGLVSAAYLLGWAPPAGCSALNATCVGTTDPPNWKATTEVNIFALYGEPPAQDASTTGTVSGTLSSIPASVTTAIPAGPIMITTNASAPSSGSYQILQTSGAAAGATSIPITGSPTANANYPSGSAIMVQLFNSSKNSVPTGSTLTSLVSTVHAAGADAIISIGGSNDPYWSNECPNGFAYLFGAEMAHYISTYGLDGVEWDSEQGSTADWDACWNQSSQEVHAIATAAGHVPIVYVDFNQSDTSDSVAAAAATQVDQFAFFYYGWNPTTNYNCANSCSQLAGYLSKAVSAGVPAAKWLAGQGVSYNSPPFSQGTSATVLATTTSSVSGAVTSIPVTALSSAIPQGTFILATTDGPPPTNYEILQTSGAASGATSIPVTGYCKPAGWTYGQGNCVTTSSVTLNASYASGDDVIQAAMGYATGAYNLGGWDCGPNAAFAAAHNMLGVMEWGYDGSGNTKLCFDQIQPFVSGGFG
jgi:hypothetical protein